MKQLSPHEPIELRFDHHIIELKHNKCVLPEGPNIRENKDVDEIWIKGTCINGENFIYIYDTPSAKLIAEAILKLCQ